MLRKDDKKSFCCLGVLVDTIAPEAWDVPNYASTIYTLAGIDNEITSGHYIVLNDDLGASFAEIALDIRQRHLGANQA